MVAWSSNRDREMMGYREKQIIFSGEGGGGGTVEKHSNALKLDLVLHWGLHVMCCHIHGSTPNYRLINHCVCKLAVLSKLVTTWSKYYLSFPSIWMIFCIGHHTPRFYIALNHRRLFELETSWFYLFIYTFSFFLLVSHCPVKVLAYLAL